MLLGLLAFAAPALAAPPTTDTDAEQAEAIEFDERGAVVVPEPSEQAMRWYRSGNVL
ncbi:hypothetical protein ENSA7_13160 [Enhygromyxa salina]|uniref:Uncharacterized protein n=2 Tax=Enhygromyxa salina TaxID=215803 RepID=A0A2S9YUY3_9BACT|nr:hypothetical protein ENSA7_13160 [Enhygromyxa salina]